MRFNFKKVAAIGATALLTGMSAGVAAAAAYPSPFTSGGTAVVYGSNAASTDVASAYDIQSDLTGSSTGGGDVVSGETTELWLSSNKLYMNDSLQDGGSTFVGNTELSNLLADTEFQGAADGASTKTTKITHTVEIGSTPRLEFDQGPTTSDEPGIMWDLPSTKPSSSNTVLNLTLDFDNAINFTDTDSVGEEFTLFGESYTVGASTDNSSLYLLGASDEVQLGVNSDDRPSSASVTVDGESYTVSLDYTSDTSASVTLTDSSGNSKTKEINEDESASMLDIDVSVTLANEDANGVQIADVSIGTGQLLLEDGSKVQLGSDEENVDGTNVIFDSGLEDITQIVLQTSADTDTDAIVEGQTYSDNIFGSVNLIFSGMNIPMGSSDREVINVSTSQSLATVDFTTDDGASTDVTWYHNDSATASLGDSDGNQIVVREGDYVNNTANGFEFVVVGNEDTGHLLRLSEVSNDTSGSNDGTDDDVTFDDVMSGQSDVGTVTISGEGSGTLKLDGASYSFTYADNTSVENDEYVTFDFDSSGGTVDMYPTIETLKGANLAFYEPITLDLNDAGDGSSTDISRLDFPDGDGFTTVDVAHNGSDEWNFTDDSGTTVSLVTGTATNSVTLSIGQLTYELNGTGTGNNTLIQLRDVDDNRMTRPGLVLFEEQDDDNNNYEAYIVQMGGLGTSSNAVSVSDAEDTWMDDSRNSTNGLDSWQHEVQLESNDDLYREMDLWGTIVTVDQSDSDSHDVSISYPDQQIYAKMYLGESTATVTGGSSGGATAEDVVVVTDNEVSSVQSRNLIVVGGSCINSVAANLVGGAYCGSSWTDNTNVGSGQFLIQSYDSPYTSGQVATLVAGYSASDTVNAATYLRTQAPDTAVGQKYVGTTSTSAELQTEESSA